MMYEFLLENRAELEKLCREKVLIRPGRAASRAQLQQGIPIFLDQLIRTLQFEKVGQTAQGVDVSGPSGGDLQSNSEVDHSSAIHGQDLLDLGYSIDQVVHDYGDLCQATTELAFKNSVDFGIEEFRTLNLCLDNAIAGAVTSFSRQRDIVISDQQALATNESLGWFAHELRNHLNTANLAVTAIKLSNAGLGGATGAVLDRSLVGLRSLIDRSLTQVRVGAGMTLQKRVFSVADFIGEVKYSAQLEASLVGCVLAVEPVDPLLMVDADRDLLFSAVSNLLQNAFKFSPSHAHIGLRAFAMADRIHIDVKDQCGGLPAGAADTLFQPFTQAGANRTGLGLGLTITRRSIEANDGHLTVADLPGEGCVFTIDLPRRTARGA